MTKAIEFAALSLVCTALLCAGFQVKRLMPVGFHTGGEFLDEIEDTEKRALIRGTYNGMLTATMFGAPLKEVQELQTCADGMNDKQLAAIVTKYIRVSA